MSSKPWGMPSAPPSYAQEKYDQQISQVRAALGDEAFAATFEEGRVMTWEQAVAMALGETKE